MFPLSVYATQGLHGVVYGMLLFLVSSGLTLVFGMMGILNIAHAAFYMLGAYVASTSGDRRLLQTRPRQVYDVTGAGDMAFAMLAAARAAGANWEEATALANVSDCVPFRSVSASSPKRQSGPRATHCRRSRVAADSTRAHDE